MVGVKQSNNPTIKKKLILIKKDKKLNNWFTIKYVDWKVLKHGYNMIRN